MKLNGLDLFSGIAGLSIALDEWVTPIAFCENDKYCQSVLLSRMRENTLPSVPIWDDVTTLSAQRLMAFPKVDIIYGGFPCQDISVAGNKKGMAGKRSGLFQEIARLTQEIQPAFVFLENVPAITTRGLDTVLSAFTQLRYDCRWTIVSAAEVGAPHLRKRWFLLAANSDSFKLREQSGGGRRQKRKNSVVSRNDGEKELVANTLCERLEGQGKFKSALCAETNTNWKANKFIYECESEVWKVEPALDRVVDGLPHRTHRIKCLGNAVVPRQAREAFMRLAGLK